MTRTLTVKISQPLAARLSAAVRRRRTTQSALVREALEGHLESERPLRASSFLSLAGDIIGSLSGPADLSSSRKYRRGYGR